jgi:hypothetical protein
MREGKITEYHDDFDPRKFQAVVAALRNKEQADES